MHNVDIIIKIKTQFHLGLHSAFITNKCIVNILLNQSVLLTLI